jgi:G3E family GTPase
MPRAPLPVTVLTGFLGAGKTTLLVRLLRQAPDAGAAVILNELGVAGTEELEVKQAYLELTQGCVCCVRADDLIAALASLRGRDDVARVIVETTGVADPLALTFVLERPDLEAVCRLDGVVTVVDAVAPAVGVPEWEAQVRAADLVLVSKLDLGGGLDEVASLVRARNPAARVLAASEADPEVVFGVERVTRAGQPLGHSGFAAVSVAGPELYDAERLEDLLESLPKAVVRAKGIVRVGDGRWMSFHVVAGRAQVNLEASAPAHGESRLVFIGRGVDEAALRASLAAIRQIV